MSSMEDQGEPTTMVPITKDEAGALWQLVLNAAPNLVTADVAKSLLRKLRHAGGKER
jgi:hypothetical protein